MIVVRRVSKCETEVLFIQNQSAITEALSEISILRPSLVSKLERVGKAAVFSWALFRKMWWTFPVVSKQTAAFFQSMSRTAETLLPCPDYVTAAWHWLKMHILKSPVKRPVCCLYQCFVSLVELNPALGKVHAKSITQFLSTFLLEE